MRNSKKGDGVFPKDHIFTTEEVMERLEPIVDKTLGEIDIAGVFERTKVNPKITGIAGNVIEQSVLGYRANSDQAPDILLDGVETEVKATGIRRVKGGGDDTYQAKEPMSITAVSVETIVSEEFDFSNFKHKIDQMLIIYYLYDSDHTVKAVEYAGFPVKGYEVHRFDDHDMDVLRRDWTTVRDFIRTLQDEYAVPENEYHRLSHELRDKLMYIDTAPKWPHRPRFRLKRSLVDEMVRGYFDERRHSTKGSITLEDFDSYSELDRVCHEFTERYRGRTVMSLMSEFGVQSGERIPKSVAEVLVVRMFGVRAKKMRDIDLFRKIGLNAKTISLSSNGGRTEDMKLMPVDISEFFDENIDFEDSAIRDYFANHQLLCIMFQEKDSEQNFGDNRFLGFKRLVFDDGFIEEEVRRTWEDARSTVFQGRLRETVLMNRDGSPRTNKKGNMVTSVNFPKSRDYDVFFRGTGMDSDDKPVVLAGVRMYRQDIWIKGKTIVNELECREFI